MLPALEENEVKRAFSGREGTNVSSSSSAGINLSNLLLDDKNLEVADAKTQSYDAVTVEK